MRLDMRLDTRFRFYGHVGGIDMVNHTWQSLFFKRNNVRYVQINRTDEFDLEEVKMYTDCESWSAFRDLLSPRSLSEPNGEIGYESDWIGARVTCFAHSSVISNCNSWPAGAASLLLPQSCMQPCPDAIASNEAVCMFTYRMCLFSMGSKIATKDP